MTLEYKLRTINLWQLIYKIGTILSIMVYAPVSVTAARHQLRSGVFFSWALCSHALGDNLCLEGLMKQKDKRVSNITLR